jgi:chorismate mutase/prephenate dehydratase
VAEGKRELHELRQQMAQIDGQLLALLNGRAKAARRIGELQKDHPPAFPLTDHAALRELVARSSGELPEQALREIFAAVFSSCLALELPIEVAFAGLEGSPAHAAARGRFGQTAALGAVASTREALDEVSRRNAEFALIPFETSIDGPLHEAITALVASELRVIEMLDVTLDLHLLNRSGHLPDVKKVYATATDRDLCARALCGLGAPPLVIVVESPLVACQLAVGDSDAGALAADGFGTALGLEVARRSMLDTVGARARYAVVGRRPSGRTGNEATTLVFSIQEGPESLIDVLKVFADRGLPLTKIQSHPVPGETWTYLFCAEVAGHFTDRPLVVAFEEIKRITRFFKLLGSYPAR